MRGKGGGGGACTHLVLALRLSSLSLSTPLPHFWLAAGLMGRSAPASAAAPAVASPDATATAATSAAGGEVHSSCAASRRARSVCFGGSGCENALCGPAAAGGRGRALSLPRVGMMMWGVGWNGAARAPLSPSHLPSSHVSAPPTPPPGTGGRRRPRRRRRVGACWGALCEPATSRAPLLRTSPRTHE